MHPQRPPLRLSDRNLHLHRLLLRPLQRIFLKMMPTVIPAWEISDVKSHSQCFPCWYHRRHHLEEDPLEGAEEEAVEVYDDAASLKRKRNGTLNVDGAEDGASSPSKRQKSTPRNGFIVTRAVNFASGVRSSVLRLLGLVFPAIHVLQE
jgi:hypothetical protein